jgi:hypothetical protein
MKKFFLPLIIAFAAGSLYAIDLPENILTVYRHKDFFRLRELSADKLLNDAQKLYLSAMLNNAFCNLEKSEEEADKYIKNYPPEYSDTLYIQLLEVQLNNYIKLGKYEGATSIVRLILKNEGGKLRADEVKELKNNLKMVESLRGVPKQEIEMNAPEGIEFTRDVANLININVECGGIKQNAVFDTGANLSVVVDSVAKKMNIVKTGDSISVKAATGAEIFAGIGVAKELKINNILLKNVLFLIFPNEALSFGTFYKIDMVIGFPVIRDLGQIIFDLKENQIFVTNRELDQEGNMFLNGLTPVIDVKFENENLLFTFDSGAKETHFNKFFLSTLEKYPQYKVTDDSIMVGSAGGIITKKVNKTESVKLTVAGKEITLKNVNIFKEDMLEISEFLHGNLGQDVISSGSGFIMDFKKMVFKILD